MTKKIIYLPLFSWFYYSIHSFDYDYIIEMFSSDIICKEWFYLNLSDEDKKLAKDLDYSDLSDLFDKYYDIDYEKYNNDYCIEYLEAFKKKFSKDLLNEIWIELLEYKWLESPAYYNYDTDHINVEVNYDIKKIKQYLLNNKEAFSTYILKANTSYDGFSAYGTNVFEEYIWKDDFEAFELTQIIAFYIQENTKTIDEDIELELYYNTSDNICFPDYITLINNKND